MDDKKELMVVLKPEFKKKLFSLFLKKYGFKNIFRFLNRSHGDIYHHKNNRGKYAPLSLIKKVCNLCYISEKELKINVVEVISKEDMKKRYLNPGRDFRIKQLQKWKEEIPDIKEIIKEDYIDVEKWFYSYKKLIDFGCRHFSEISIEENKLILRYTNYADSVKKEFINYLPRKIKIDDEFQYFFGLWCGDRLNGRFGVANKNKEINFFTRDYLLKLYQKAEFDLLYSPLIKKPELDYKIDRVIINKKSDKKGYCVMVGIKNRIMFSFFDYLLKNLDSVLELIPNINIFFAGLFDAEGNVFLEGGCFRWSCKNRELLNIYIKYMIKEKLFNRYDGANIVSYNKEKFSKEIFPYLKHGDKKNKANLLCNYEGNLDKRFFKILNIVKENNGNKNKDLAKVLKRENLYLQLKFLERLGYIEKKDYPNRNYITMKGLNEIQRGQG